MTAPSRHRQLTAASRPRLFCSHGGAAVCRQPKIKLRVLDLSLTGGAVPVDGKPSIGFGIFYLSLAGWPRTVAGETSIAFFILDAPLTGGAFSILGQTFVPSRILNASLASRSRFGFGVAGRFSRLDAHCPTT